ncbi:NAD(P)H-dependent glycerol-3-phosphate dehydrogenase [bacterium]|nr:MAG: NAD(P)H-dependent glycerol-3-phosphate dehydrogenase [bacterium]QQR62147.1 MAG: NAD(P)H-dependent glycerol-3-phosphate dehydrogenase [bacterium]
MSTGLNSHAIGIIGAGAWGTALAYVLNKNGHVVYLWSYEAEVAETMNQKRVNEKYLPEVLLADQIVITTNLDYVLETVSVVVYASPSRFIVQLLKDKSVSLIRSKIWVLASKGIDEVHGWHVLDLLQSIVPIPLENISVLSGPTFATELCRDLETFAVIAAAKKELALFVKRLFQNKFFKFTISSDVEGILWCGALKNVAALLLGMIDGIGYGKNVQAFLFVKIVDEIVEWLVLVGGKKETAYDIVGIGDFYLTACSDMSKNRMYGFYVGQKQQDDFIRSKIPIVPEGVGSACGLYECIQKNSLSAAFPLLASVHIILKKRCTAQAYLEQFLGKIE